MFNVAVDVFELIADLDAVPQSEAYVLFMESYRIEEQDGHDHRVTGNIWCGAGSVAEILDKVFHQKSREPAIR